MGKDCIARSFWLFSRAGERKAIRCWPSPVGVRSGSVAAPDPIVVKRRGVDSKIEDLARERRVLDVLRATDPVVPVAGCGAPGASGDLRERTRKRDRRH